MKISNEIIEDIKEKPNQFTSVVGVSSNLYFLGMANVSQLFLFAHAKVLSLGQSFKPI